jgi:ADP-ribosylglycohydrolase
VVTQSIVDSPGYWARLRGALLAGAVGDALGAPVESTPWQQIVELHGPRGLTDYVPAYDGIGTITDDTQLTLFTLEGVIRAHVRLRVEGDANLAETMQLAYQRWLHTQGVSWANCRGPRSTAPEPDGWLVTVRGLHRRRCPGATCFFALRDYGKTGEIATFSRRVNNSKGCGGVMRAAPAALWAEDPAEVFTVAATAAAITHSHPSGYLSAGTLAVIVQQLLRGAELLPALDRAVRELTGWDGHGEQLRAIERAVDLAGQGTPSPERVAELGGGNVGESALAIALYAVLSTSSLDEALLVAVNHNGDSDSTGSVCGNIAGARYGVAAIRSSWLDRLEHRDIIDQLITDAMAEFSSTPPADLRWLLRYPVTSTKEITVSPNVTAISATGVAPDRWRGSLLAGAVGDALGEAIEFNSVEQIREMCGPEGLTGYRREIGYITDDTQMTLFTLEGLIRADVRRKAGQDPQLTECLQGAYQRWLHTQGLPWENARGPHSTVDSPDGWLITERELFHRRAPGATCMQALRHYGQTGIPATVDRRVNDSKGCGGVMRAAPAALWSADPAEVFEAGVISAALTHSHPSGYLSAGTFAVMVRSVLEGAEVRDALNRARAELRKWDGHEEQEAALEHAIRLAAQGNPSPDRIHELGGGWVGEEALAISVYAALSVDDPHEALLLSVNHSGDSDSTGAILGNILGAKHGLAAVRPDWLNRLELRTTINQLATDALTQFSETPRTTPEWALRYPTGSAAIRRPDGRSAPGSGWRPT